MRCENSASRPAIDVTCVDCVELDRERWWQFNYCLICGSLVLVTAANQFLPEYIQVSK